MRILFDQGVPVPLRRVFPAHSTSTAYEMGWAELTNGALLKQADAQFDAFITTDQGLRFQQNLAALRLAIVVLETTDWSVIRKYQDEIVATANAARPGEVIVLTWH
jgi:hypothetical protein